MRSLTSLVRQRQILSSIGLLFILDFSTQKALPLPAFPAFAPAPWRSFRGARGSVGERACAVACSRGQAVTRGRSAGRCCGSRGPSEARLRGPSGGTEASGKHAAAPRSSSASSPPQALTLLVMQPCGGGGGGGAGEGLRSAAPQAPEAAPPPPQPSSSAAAAQGGLVLFYELGPAAEAEAGGGRDSAGSPGGGGGGPEEAEEEDESGAQSGGGCKSCTYEGCRETTTQVAKQRKPWMCKRHRNKMYKDKYKRKKSDQALGSGGGSGGGGGGGPPGGAAAAAPGGGAGAAAPSGGGGGGGSGPGSAPASASVSPGAAAPTGTTPGSGGRNEDCTENSVSASKQRTGTVGDRPAKPTLLEQVLNQKRLSLLRSPEVVHFLQKRQQLLSQQALEQRQQQFSGASV
ncbi:regulatory factor X-associated protein [Anolis sagrei]|uniref:regulatory factor X-associated protein n=1 Tax=Anolis sagrei TaxID=38937 RepID=UPI003521E9A5